MKRREKCIRPLYTCRVRVIENQCASYVCCSYVCMYVCVCMQVFRQFNVDYIIQYNIEYNYRLHQLARSSITCAMNAHNMLMWNVNKENFYLTIQLVTLFCTFPNPESENAIIIIAAFFFFLYTSTSSHIYLLSYTILLIL